MSVEREARVHGDAEVPTSEVSTDPNTAELARPEIQASDKVERDSLDHAASRKSTGSATIHETDPPEKAAPSDADPDVLVVDWDGPDDPENPRNWTLRRKWAAALAVSSFTFISPVSSSMVAPAVEQIAQEFHITNGTKLSMTVSVFVLAYAVGPLFLSPLSEVYGRSRVLQLANLFFLVWNLACSFAQNDAQLIAFRFLSGIGGSAPLSVGGGVLGDMFRPEERGKALAIYSLAPLLGPALGPIAGAWIAELTTWRWVFRSTTIADALVQLFGIFALQETYAPVLLERKAARIRKQLDQEKGTPRKVIPVHEAERKTQMTWKELMAKALLRPFSLFAQEPIIQLLGLYLGAVYGTIYLVLTTLPGIYANVYHQRVGIVGLHYIALGLGLSITTQISSRLLDKIYAHLKSKNGGVAKPEYRLPLAIPISLGVPIGLLMVGWGAQEHVHWIVPDIGFALVGAGSIGAFQGVQMYIIDAFTIYAASALAAVACLRSIAGFAFPLFAPDMYNTLGYGKGNTILAVIAFVLGPPTLMLFLKYGERIRLSSKRGREAHKAASKGLHRQLGST
ncbi:MFS polyamine transporter [Panus rudis PR-1116 ss-1]|nr:MFS polyamine transporter [Panus rudis PR-1116 ss-1]